MFTDLLLGLVLFTIITLVISPARRSVHMWRIEQKVDALLKHAGIQFSEYDAVPESVVQALGRGETVVAIKQLREATGMSLSEAKEFVEELRKRRA